MTETGEQGGLESPKSGLSLRGVTRGVRDEFHDDSHQEILRGTDMIESEGQEVLQEFNDLLRKKTGVKSRFTSTKTATENDLKNEERNTNKTHLHVTFLKSMLDMKLETLGKEKALLDKIFGI